MGFVFAAPKYRRIFVDSGFKSNKTYVVTSILVSYLYIVTIQFNYSSSPSALVIEQLSELTLSSFSPNFFIIELFISFKKGEVIFIIIINTKKANMVTA